MSIPNPYLPPRMTNELVGFSNSSFVLERINATGSDTYTVPSGKILVIHGLHITGGSGAANYLRVGDVSTIGAASSRILYMADRFRLLPNGTTGLTHVSGVNDYVQLTTTANGLDVGTYVGSSSRMILVDADYVLFPIAAGVVLSASVSANIDFWGLLYDE